MTGHVRRGNPSPGGIFDSWRHRALVGSGGQGVPGGAAPVGALMVVPAADLGSLAMSVVLMVVVGSLGAKTVDRESVLGQGPRAGTWTSR
jgi:hypothetical protein